MLLFVRMCIEAVSKSDKLHRCAETKNWMHVLGWSVDNI
jgi:hypothetical protein